MRSASLAYVGKLAVAGVLLALFETTIAKMRVFRVPDFVGVALMLGFLAVLLRFRLGEPLMKGLAFDFAHLLAGGLVLISFMLLYQNRLYSLLNVFALQAVVLSLSVAWQAYVQDAPHLYVTAAIALVFKAIDHPDRAAPDHRASRHSPRGRDRRSASAPPCSLGMGLVALSMVVMLRVTADADPLGREDLAFALSVVMLGLLMMVTRRNAVSQVVGFMSLGERPDPRGHRRQGNAAGGRNHRRLLGACRLHCHRRLPVPHSRAFRHRRCPGARPVPGSAAMNAFVPDSVALILAIPAATAAILALTPGYWLSARLNVLSSLLTFVAALSLFVRKPETGPYILVDDLNIVFIVLNTFVAFTTSVFSASYIAHELEIGRLTPVQLRFYHAMYQLLLFGMNLALVANNIGLMWVAIEMATLTTVLMVGIYRTPEAIEAAWKYFILGSVGIALALFGTILVYMAARPVVGEGLDGMVWTALIAHVSAFDPAQLNLAFVFLMLGYGTKVGLAPLHAWLPDAHAEGPTPISAVLSGLLAQRSALRRASFQTPARRQSGRDRSGSADGDRWVSSRSYSPPSCCTGAATSNECSLIRRSSTWGSLPLPLASAARSPISPAFCT